MGRLRCWLWACALASMTSLAACGSDDGGGGGGSAGTGATDAGSDVGAGGTGGSTPDGSSDGSGGLDCKASGLPFEPSTMDCAGACAAFGAWGTTGSCANPYDDAAECVLVCETTNAGLAYVNVLFGCAALHSDCAAYAACHELHCG